MNGPLRKRQVDTLPTNPYSVLRAEAEKLETETVEARLLSLPQPTIEPRHPQHG